MNTELSRLAELIRMRNSVEVDIARIIHRPASIGHLGEYIAAEVFGIELARSASNKGFDGWFRTGALVGKTVNVKWYARREGLLDINPTAIPDYYLILSGPKTSSMDKTTRARSWVIESVYLFDAPSLIEKLSGRVIGIATSVPARLWDDAEIYPRAMAGGMELSESQQMALGLFSGVEPVQ